MDPVDFLVRRQSVDDVDRTLTGQAFDDIDMLLSKRDGSLIPVAVIDGVHVCQQCSEQFVDEPSSPLRMVEFNCGGGGVRIGIHSKCVTKARKVLQKRGDKGNFVSDMSMLHRARRKFTQLTKPFRA